MKVTLTADVERVEGKQHSGQDVGEELAVLLRGEEVEVEDSVFSVTDAEVTATSAGADAGPEVGALLADLMDAYTTAFPINLGDSPVHEATDDERRRITLAIIALQSSPAVGEAIRKARFKKKGGRK